MVISIPSTTSFAYPGATVKPSGELLKNKDERVKASIESWFGVGPNLLI